MSEIKFVGICEDEYTVHVSGTWTMSPGLVRLYFGDNIPPPGTPIYMSGFGPGALVPYVPVHSIPRTLSIHSLLTPKQLCDMWNHHHNRSSK